MGRERDSREKKCSALLDKNLTNALSHRIKTQFPRIGGPRITDLCSEMIMELLDAHLVPRAHLRHGQVLWMGVSVDDPPSRGKRIAETDLVPLTLDLVLPEDIEGVRARESREELLTRRAVRLSQQAFGQNALLSNCDLGALLNVSDAYVSQLICKHERKTGTVVPRRATLHDVGTGLTHKRIICRKRFLEGKSSHEVAQETHHSIEAVDRYLGQYDRVRHCRQENFSPEETAYTLNCSLDLVRQYHAIDDELVANRAETG